VSGSFGAGTEAALKAFQRKHHIAASGVYGSVTHHALSPFYDLAGRRALQAVAHTRAQLAKYARINHGESYAWLHRTSMAYSQSASRAFLPLLPGFPRATDCSGYATWLYKISGLPDPSGFAYRVVGYTGTLAAHGVRVSANGALHPGDLVFYGGGWPYGHVAIVVNGFTRTVSSHGSPGIKVVPFNYRPVSAIRRYF
jgi:cell wall-associated NlpC family hydrolase